MANRNQDKVVELNEENKELAKKLETTVLTQKDTDAQLIKLLELQKRAGKDLEEARGDNKRLFEELIQLRASLVDKKNMNEQMQKTEEKLAEMEAAVHRLRIRTPS